MKYSSVFRLSLLALLLAGCGEDDAGTTAWTRPEEPAAAGNPVVCRLSIDDGDESPEAETRTAYGPLTNGFWPIYWRSGDRVEVISPQTTPQRATVEVRVSGATESEADLSDTGMVWGEGLHDFYAFYPSGAIRANAGSIVVAAVPAVQTCNNGECNMQYACMSACAEDVAQGEVVSFAFRPLMTTVVVSVGFSETVEVQKLVLSSANDAVAGQFTHDIAANVSTVDPDRRSNVLALHLTTGDAPYIRINAGSKIVVTAFMLPQDIRGLTLTAVTTQGRTYSYTTPATLRAGHCYSFSVGDMPAQAQHIASDRSDWMKYLPDNAFLSQVSIPGSHDACAIYGSHYEYKSGMPQERYHFKWLLSWLGNTNITKVTKAQELSIEEQLAAGVRMFDLRPCASSASVKDLPIHHGISVLGDPARGGYTPGASGRQELSPFLLSQVLDRFVRFLEEHPGETLLVHMKYENTSTNANKRGWNKSVVSYIKSRCNGRIADFTPRMTLADARGKILFVIREDYKSDNGGEYLGAYLNWTNDKVVFETTLHGNTGEAAPIKVNDLYDIKNGASDGVSKYAAIDECIAYTYNATDVARWCMNYVSCYDIDHCSVTGLGILGALGDYDYCANRYNRYTADKLNRPDFRGNAGIVLMDFAGASNATMTYGQTYSDMAVYGDDLVEAVIGANNKWDLRRNE
mgnify:FL=1